MKRGIKIPVNDINLSIELEIAESNPTWSEYDNDTALVNLSALTSDAEPGCLY